jgi:hypothetical protein
LNVNGVYIAIVQENVVSSTIFMARTWGISDLIAYLDRLQNE